MKLGKKINVVLVTVIAVILTIGFWVIIGIEGKAIEKQVRMDVSTVTELVRQDVARMFTQITSQKESLQEVINTLAQHIPGIKYIEVVDLKGDTVATTRAADVAKEDQAGKLAIVKEVLEKKETVFAQRSEDTFYELEFHVPVFDDKNKIINVIETEIKTRTKSVQDVAEAKRSLDIASVSVAQGTRSINLAIEDGMKYIQSIVNDASQLGKFDKSAELGFFHDVAIFDTGLNLLANTGNDPGEFTNEDPKEIKDRNDVVIGAKESVEYDAVHEGRGVIVRVEPIKIHDMQEMAMVGGKMMHDMSSMRIVGVIETHTLKSAYEDRVKELKVRMLGVGVVFTAIMVIVLAIILEREVVGPIRRYSVTAKKIADGDLSQTVEHTSNDEIGQFGDVFNSMVKNLRELDKLKSDFTSVAAHQLRTPLSGVKWVLKLLLDGDLGVINDDQKGMLKRGYETNEKMIQLVNDLLNVTRIENGKFGYNFEKNDFMKLINTLMENTVLPSKERNIEVRLENRAGVIPEFMFDMEKLLVALQNIVDNAMKYTLPGGKVTIIVDRQGDYLQVKVSDTGVGIPKADIEKLFSKFFRAANVIHLQTDGSGLGLFIVKSIIVRHGGQVWVDSIEGKGTTFTVVVPVIAGLLPKDEPGQGPVAEVKKEGATS